MSLVLRKAQSIISLRDHVAIRKTCPILLKLEIQIARLVQSILSSCSNCTLEEKIQPRTGLEWSWIYTRESQRFASLNFCVSLDSLLIASHLEHLNAQEEKSPTSTVMLWERCKPERGCFWNYLSALSNSSHPPTIDGTYTGFILNVFLSWGTVNPELCYLLDLIVFFSSIFLKLIASWHLTTKSTLIDGMITVNSSWTTQHPRD